MVSTVLMCGIYSEESPSFSGLQVTGTQEPQLPPHWPAVAPVTVSGTPCFAHQPVTKRLFWGESTRPPRGSPHPCSLAQWAPTEHTVFLIVA